MLKRHLAPQTSLILLLLASLACALPASTPPAEATSLPSPAAPTPGETPTALDPCLLGAWTMDAYALNNKFLDLTASPYIGVVAPSATTLEFRDDNTFATGGQITVRFDIPNTADYIEMDGFPQGQGSYAADGSTLAFSGVTFSVEFGEMRAFINGEQADAPFGSMSMPEDGLAPPASADYVCSGNSLTMTYAGPSGAITEEWAK